MSDSEDADYIFGCEHLIKAADVLAKAVSNLRGIEIGSTIWWGREKGLLEALAAYEKVRDLK